MTRADLVLRRSHDYRFAGRSRLAHDYRRQSPIEVRIAFNRRRGSPPAFDAAGFRAPAVDVLACGGRVRSYFRALNQSEFLRQRAGEEIERIAVFGTGKDHRGRPGNGIDRYIKVFAARLGSEGWAHDAEQLGC